MTKQNKMPPPTLSEDTKDTVTTARVNLYTDYPFFACLAQYMKPKGSWMVPTAGVSSKSDGADTRGAIFWLNPKFGEKCNIRDMVWILAHEVMHFVTATMSRQPEGANHMLWNVASDIAINYILSDREQGAGLPLPRPDVIKPLFGDEFAKYNGWVTEDIYYDLLREHQKNCPYCQQKMKQSGDQKDDQQNSGQGDNQKDDQSGDQQQSGGSGEDFGDSDYCPGPGGGKDYTSGEGNAKDGCFKGYWWDGSGSETTKDMSDEEIAEWKNRISSAAATARQAGKLSGDLSKFVTDLMQPRKDWRKLLRNATNRCLRKRWDWKKVGRRTAGRVRTPGKSPYLPTAVSYIDTSGSMSDEDITQAITEVSSIISLGGGKGILILGDAEVYYCGEMTVDGLRTLPVKRGGTDFRCVFDKITEEDIHPAIFIGFSDLEGPFPDNPPDFPVIWCRPEGWKSDAPWGKVIDIDL